MSSQLRSAHTAKVEFLARFEYKYPDKWATHTNAGVVFDNEQAATDEGTLKVGLCRNMFD